MRKWASKILVPAIMVGLAAIQSFGIDAGRATIMQKSWQQVDSIQKVEDSILHAQDSLDRIQDSIAHVQDSIKRRKDSIAAHVRDSLQRRRDSILDARQVAANPIIDSLQPISDNYERKLDSLAEVSRGYKATIDSLKSLADDVRGGRDSVSLEDSLRIHELDSLRGIEAKLRYATDYEIKAIKRSYNYKNTTYQLAKMRVRAWNNDSIFIDSMRKQIDSFGYDVMDSLALLKLDSLELKYDVPYIDVKDTLRIPDSLQYTDPFKFKYYWAIKDTNELHHVRDSLLAIPDSIELAKVDSLYIEDSTAVAHWKFMTWYNGLSKKDRKRYDYEQALPAKIHRMDSILNRKDSIKAYKDSVKEATPRIFESYIVPDSLQYKRLITWTHTPKTNNVNMQKVDTTYNTHFYDYPFYQEDYEATYLGVVGSAAQNYNFFRRKTEENVVFYTPYQAYSYSPETLPQYNTKTPYTELAYWGTLFSNSNKEESEIKILTTQNITPALNLNLEYHRFGGKGLLQHEATDNRTAVIGLNYAGKNYLMHGGYIYNKVGRNENGGAVDQKGDFNWIRDTTVTDVRELDVYLSDAASLMKKHTFFLDQSYRLPFSFLADMKEKKAEKIYKDSLMTYGDSTEIAEYQAWEKEMAALPDTLNKDVTSMFFGHASEVSMFRRTYTDKISSSDTYGREMFQNYYFNPTTSADSMRVMRIDNKIYARLQPWKADGIVSRIDAGVGDKVLTYFNFSPDAYLGASTKQLFNNLYVYGGAQGQYKKYLHWDADAQYTFLGREQNDLSVNANLDVAFYPFRKARTSPLTLGAHFETTLKRPDFYEEHFHSNHFMWDNDFKKVSQTKIEGKLDIPYWKLDLNVGYALLSNNIYYDNMMMVQQNTAPMSVISAALRKEFVLWKFHLDNKVLVQYSTNSAVLPLPLVTVHLRYFFQFNVVKNVLQMQIGADGIYNTKWYAQGYNPVLGVFYNQNEAMYGNRPYIDAFVNMQWKRATIFIKAVNVNMGWPFDHADYFSAHHYIKPVRTIKFGIWWPFYVKPSTKSTASLAKEGGSGGASSGRSGSSSGGRSGASGGSSARAAGGSAPAARARN